MERDQYPTLVPTGSVELDAGTRRVWVVLGEDEGNTPVPPTGVGGERDSVLGFSVFTLPLFFVHSRSPLSDTFPERKSSRLPSPCTLPPYSQWTFPSHPSPSTTSHLPDLETLHPDPLPDKTPRSTAGVDM